jgi:hypothetical protein
LAQYRVKPFNRDHFPALYKCADAASIKAQNIYLLFFRLNLLLLAMGALTGSFAIGGLKQKQIIYSATALLFFLSLFTTLLLAYFRWDRIWHSGRAVAESAKSLTWKFICGAEPFQHSLEERKATESFTASLNELLQENKKLSSELIGPDAFCEQITDEMRTLRISSTFVLRDAYLSQRVNEQQAWYATKATSNRHSQSNWFWILIATQALACAGTLILIKYPDVSWQGTPVISSLATAILAWVQVKKFQELSESYGLAAQELSIIAARAANVSSREDLARFVNDSETAISREHSMWVARRETVN